MQASVQPSAILGRRPDTLSHTPRVARRYCRRSTDSIVRWCQSSDDEALPSADWRNFRAKLIAAERELGFVAEPQGTAQRAASPSVQSDGNMKILEMQDPQLYRDGVWAHTTPGLEQGCVLLATLQCPEILQDEALEQVVILLVSHGPEGSMGLILNRPTPLTLGRQRGGLRFDIQNAPDEMQEVFGDVRVYCGGPVAQNVVHIMHPYSLGKAVQIVPGLHLGGESEAVSLVKAGTLDKQQFKFFSGALVWEPGQLEREIQAGCWQTAACSRSLVLKQAIQLPTPLWREVMLLCGGACAEAAEAAYEGDEVSGE